MPAEISALSGALFIVYSDQELQLIRFLFVIQEDPNSSQRMRARSTFFVLLNRRRAMPDAK